MVTSSGTGGDRGHRTPGPRWAVGTDSVHVGLFGIETSRFIEAHPVAAGPVRSRVPTGAGATSADPELGKARAYGLLIGMVDANQVARIAPPLTITEVEIDDLVIDFDRVRCLMARHLRNLWIWIPLESHKSSIEPFN